MFDKLKNMNAMRNQANEMKRLLEQEKASGISKDEMIKITLNGNQEMVQVEIDPRLLQTDQQAQIQAGVIQAYGDAHKKVQQLMVKHMGAIKNLMGM